MNTKPDISIIIVNYNVKEFLYDCIRSIEKAKKDLQIEIIVVDNNSSDASVQFLQPIFPYIRFISLDENIGFGRANNIAIEQSTGKFVLILNPDTILNEDTLSDINNYMQAHPEAGIAGVKILNKDGSFQLACRRGFPTPWAAFCKLYGLQKLFPKSPFFARYNQTFRDIDQTYEVDAVMGAFMFCRREVLQELNGFDPEFFMYGEDLDLCYRAKKIGWKVVYVHSTSIVHFKGESTRRSSLNDVKIFYDAMAIFARKHTGSSIFLIFIKIGIFLRTLIAHFIKHKSDFLLILYDIISVNFSLILATKIRKGEFFNFPDYAYPTVFIVASLVIFSSMFFIGEYFESKPSVRRSFTGMMSSFFILSSLTYFFNEYAFSRGILLMTIGFSIILTSALRLVLDIYDKNFGRTSVKRVAFIGINELTDRIIQSITSENLHKIDIAGLIIFKDNLQHQKYPIIGHADYIQKIIDDYRLDEVIITDSKFSGTNLIRILENSHNPSVRFHIAHRYEEFIISNLIENIVGLGSTAARYNLTLPRYRFAKRTIDIIFSFILLTICLPLLFVTVENRKKTIRDIYYVLIGKYSLIGLFHLNKDKIETGKIGLTGLAHLSRPENLSPEAINDLNNYYLQNYKYSLDIDIFFKFIFRKKRGF
ncbi:MAG: glycosyl transferase family 2 [Ignavibacteria bacterium]|nr:glycosyl transferase family 2 [Ignavibacteria bacterium]